jgi:hypothetical protein
MKEDFLHHLWLYKRLDINQLQTTSGAHIQILHFGHYLQTAGPDFFNAQLIIGDQKWAGNIEMHLKSSDWYLHNHQTDVNYDNVILHVVWEHDIDVFRKNNEVIPVLELKNYVSNEQIKQYQNFFRPKSWINCENELALVEEFLVQNWQERLFFERLEQKSQVVKDWLLETQNDWEQVTFGLLFKNFGLNSNGAPFFAIAKELPFSIVRKERENLQYLEALFFGISGLLESDFEDKYPKALQQNWRYLKQKYQLKTVGHEVHFFKLRPDNFPTIRLAQLAALFHKHHSIFQLLIATNSLNDFRDLFKVSASKYWETHYQFDKESPKKKKPLSSNFVDLLLVNSVLPLQFAYSNYQGTDKSEDLLELIKQLKAESNTVISKFATIGISSENAFQTQALLQLKKMYCEMNRCLQCQIGIHLLKN